MSEKQHLNVIESGDRLGALVFWVRCSCGYIGRASGREHEAATFGRREHPEK